MKMHVSRFRGLLRQGALGLGLAMAACGAAMSAGAQDGDVAPEFQCLRYVQSHERNLHIPRGLLTAVSLAEAGRSMADGTRMAWPWTINVAGQGRYFETKDDAVAETRRLLDDGQRSIDVGCMQINLRYHPNAFRSIEDAFDPALNVAYGAQFLKNLHQLQGSWAKAVERYHSSEDGRREEYRERVLAIWNNEARSIVMDAVLSENTDTPYHQAIKDYMAGRYAEALDKYQGIVDTSPRDRIGLLGVAMSYEQLGRDAEADEAYVRYLSVEPSNQNVLTRMIEKARTLPADGARESLEALVKAGVHTPELLASLAEVTSMAGDNDAALTYVSTAISQAPTISMYYLNAGVLADRLNRPAAAVQYYEQFLTLFARQPVLVDTSIDGIRDRVRFLRTRL